MKTKSILASLLVLLAAGRVAAQQAPAATPAKQAPAPRRIEGMSDAGNAVFAKAQGVPDPDLLALVRQQRQVRDQLSAAALASSVNVDRVEELLRKSEDLQGQIRQRNNDRMLAVLRELPEADRGPFLRGVTKTPAR
ncbi:hypothetical protein [uncultured Sphingomonas sp.]|uniref:hypothetical protein n=1 Tax=uncultured Sphingomonas sp. TaxID=158754 RepID=UPI0025FDB823|nr:hypothetical protein [uncultured Sphingomonas sp.]